MAKAGRILMSIDLHRLFAWFSPSFPIGAFSYSHGLEHAIETGDVTNGDELEAWLLTILVDGSGRNDAILVAHSYRAQGEALQELSDLSLAICAGHERQFESVQQGYAFAKTAGEISNFRFTPGPLPIVVGQVAAKHEIDLRDVIALYLHSFVSNLISTAIRLMPVGQTQGQHILHALFEKIDVVSENALHATLDDLGSACFLADISSMAHELQQPRIFRT
ncbi:urease accessory protein UreF [Maritalea mediterranea]|uniref:Urease accessory protein UreF n=1 Tax=Maritalea mediterranea TaxID=2909667 RepID=A0ABS9E4I4_9HYPH|nr:urease accessory protein UreF [Maritalea mediterranea]MCF4097164.1 urease accessory protein UreF [Maritalea mediterranea]